MVSSGAKRAAFEGEFSYIMSVTDMDCLSVALLKWATQTQRMNLEYTTDHSLPSVWNRRCYQPQPDWKRGGAVEAH